MTPGTDCERVRTALMALLDGEGGSDSPADRQHLATCPSCRGWLEHFQSMSDRLHGLPYQRAGEDFWPSVKDRIRDSDERLTLARRLWLIGAVVLAWRAVQLFVDLPAPIIHPLVPLAAGVAAVWLVVGDPLAIATSAPELQKRGI